MGAICHAANVHLGVSFDGEQDKRAAEKERRKRAVKEDPEYSIPVKISSQKLELSRS